MPAAARRGEAPACSTRPETPRPMSEPARQPRLSYSWEALRLQRRKGAGKPGGPERHSALPRKWARRKEITYGTPSRSTSHPRLDEQCAAHRRKQRANGETSEQRVRDHMDQSGKVGGTERHVRRHRATDRESGQAPEQAERRRRLAPDPLSPLCGSGLDLVHDRRPRQTRRRSRRRTQWQRAAATAGSPPRQPAA